jgi:mersacidin/lichenicidin family type 2 lantibiotic
MSRCNIIRAWKDEEYRQNLSATERETLPPNPAGMTELSENQLKQVAGGALTPTLWFCSVLQCPTRDCTKYCP